MTDFDVVVVGSGFGGSLVAMIARRLGLRVALVERGRHPRFAIGESTSPLANIILEQLAARYDLPRIAPLAQYGSWLRAYPDVRRGLKRGFTFYRQREGLPFATRPDRANELLVAASPNDEVADTHWLRSDVDHFFVREAIALGVEYFEETTLDEADVPGGGRTAKLGGMHRVRPFRLGARFVIDASGPRGFLSRTLGVPEAEMPPGFPRTSAIFGHFDGVVRCDALDDYRHTEGLPPYPADDAAVHHVFDGGWMWQLRFDHGVTSAGFMLDARDANRLDTAAPDASWQDLLRRFPSVHTQFEQATAIRGLSVSERVAYRSSAATGPGWAMLPSTAGFVDPLFSTGIPLTLLGVERLGRLLEGHGIGATLDTELPAYGRASLREIDRTATLVAAAYAAFGDFRTFVALSMYYFAAASFAEAARRVGRDDLARGFLADGRLDVTREIDEIAKLVLRRGADSSEIAGRMARALECINVAGLCDVRKKNWYSVDVEDTVAGAAKLESSPGEVRRAFAALVATRT